MRDLFLLVKTNLINSYNLNQIFHGKKSKLFLYAILFIYVVGGLFITFYSYAKQAADFLSQYQLMPYMIVLFVAASSFTAFTFTVYNAKSSMFNANDNDLLFSMPIKASTILASRLIYVILWNFFTSLFLMIPSLLVYAKYVDVPFQYYLSAFAVLVCLPIIPTILACIVGYIIAYLTSKSNIKNWAELFLSFAFIGLLYYGFAQIDVILKYIVLHAKDLENILKWGLYPLYLINEIFNDYNYLSLFIYVFLNIGLFILFTYVLSIKFKSIIAKLQENKTKAAYELKNLKTNSVGLVLFIKEVKRYFSSPVYVFNTSFGVILVAFVAIASIFYDKEQILKMLEVSNNGSMLPMLVTALMFIAFLSSTTAATISIEGKNYWILKSLPLSPTQIFKSKIRLNLALILPATYISLIILTFTFGLTLNELFISILLVTLATFVSAKFGLLINLKFPKMDAVNDVVIVKRSISVMIAVLVPMVIIFALNGLYSVVDHIISFNVLLVIITVILAIINILEYYLLNTWGIKRFRKIE